MDGISTPASPSSKLQQLDRRLVEPTGKTPDACYEDSSKQAVRVFSPSPKQKIDYQFAVESPEPPPPYSEVESTKGKTCGPESESRQASHFSMKTFAPTFHGWVVKKVLDLQEATGKGVEGFCSKMWKKVKGKCRRGKGPGSDNGHPDIEEPGVEQLDSTEADGIELAANVQSNVQVPAPPDQADQEDPLPTLEVLETMSEQMIQFVAARRVVKDFDTVWDDSECFAAIQLIRASPNTGRFLLSLESVKYRELFLRDELKKVAVGIATGAIAIVG